MSNAYAEPQDVPPATESERAGLLREQNLLDLQIDVAKKKAELAKYGEEKASQENDKSKDVQVEVKPAVQVTLIGVRGLNNHLTADLRVGGVPITMQAGERYGDLKLRSITPLCAAIVNSGSEKTYCLSGIPKTVSDSSGRDAQSFMRPPMQAPYPTSVPGLMNGAKVPMPPNQPGLGQ
jgi:hypothetical protein